MEYLRMSEAHEIPLDHDDTQTWPYTSPTHRLITEQMGRANNVTPPSPEENPILNRPKLEDAIELADLCNQAFFDDSDGVRALTSIIYRIHYALEAYMAGDVTFDDEYTQTLCVVSTICSDRRGILGFGLANAPVIASDEDRQRFSQIRTRQPESPTSENVADWYDSQDRRLSPASAAVRQQMIH